MSGAPDILIIDSNVSDSKLCQLVLARTFKDAAISIANDAPAFAEVLSSQRFDVAIVSPKIAWDDRARLLVLLKQRLPGTALILFGHESDIVKKAMNPGFAFEGLARKSSAGFMALAEVVTEVLERGRNKSVAANDAFNLDDLPVPAGLVDASGRLTRVNGAMDIFLGGPREHPGSALLDDLLVSAGDVARWQNFRANHEAQSRPIRFEVESAGGRPVLLAISRRLDPCGVPGFLALVEYRDEDTALKAVGHTGSSELLNQELRDIALVFSHDLKEPVQQVARLARRIEDQQQFSPGNPASRWISQIGQCANRTSDMLDSMLEYLAVSSRESPPTLVDLNTSLEQALHNLQAPIDEGGAEITSDHLPLVAGDEYQMLHLFQNLISNALKFRGREKPTLRIGVEQRGQEWELAFRDNGIGVADNFLKRIFEMGQRLHTREEYPGTGVGLAICHRIVNRHGGQIWAHSNEGAGCTFYIRLPRTPSHVTRLA